MSQPAQSWQAVTYFALNEYTPNTNSTVDSNGFHGYPMLTLNGSETTSKRIFGTLNGTT